MHVCLISVTVDYTLQLGVRQMPTDELYTQHNIASEKLEIIVYNWCMHEEQLQAKLQLNDHIKTSGSELWPRKVELMCAFKNATITVSIVHITTELV